ncbi:hypothetical protein NL108_004925 [Boleophthalmus pectinirostris]|nr:hypothetical protein NL108_004925 [Boleophthalmus pectinirostris]
MNIAKTKDMVTDFRHAPSHRVSVLHGDVVEIIGSYKYLATVKDNKLKFDLNTQSIVNREQQRMYLLRKLNSFNVNKTILDNFYCSFIENLLVSILVLKG